MNLLALPFYKDASSQVQHGRCALGRTGLISPSDRFLPFVLKRPVTGQGLDCVRVHDALSGQIVLTIQAADFPCTVYTDKIWDYYTYFGGIIIGMNLPCANYYLEVKGYFSEVFEVRDTVAGLLRIEWGNASNIASLPYGQGFIQRLYLDTALAEPDYKHDEDGEDDGDKVFVALAHRLTKTYKFEPLPVPEFLLDVFNSFAIHSNVKVGDKDDVTDFAVSKSWSNDSCVALATVSFAERPVTALTCATDDGLTLLDTSAYIPKPWLCGDNSVTTAFWEDTGDTRCVQAAAIFRSAAITEEVFRDNCQPGETPGSVFFTLAYGYAVSTVSQADADQDARAYFDANKQPYANTNAQCFSAPPPPPAGNFICQYGDDGCFTGFMVEPGTGALRSATFAECQQCFREFASNGTNYCALTCN